jgi:MFS family permease
LSSKKIFSLGLKENLPQFILLIVINIFVGAIIGMERSLIPEIGKKEFLLEAKTAILSFIVVFGVTKAITNFFAGNLCDKKGRKPILIAGWLLSIPVPLILIWAKSWEFILLANLFLGISQGLTWSTTVIMKIDLVGPQKRGLAMGLNEFAGYLAVGVSALITASIAQRFSLRPEPFYIGIFYVLIGTFLSLFFVKETKSFVSKEIKVHHQNKVDALKTSQVFMKTSLTDPNLSSVSQAGLVNNLNDGMVWGLFPLLYSQSGLNLEEIGLMASLYPVTWGIFQLFTGHLSDSWGRKYFIVYGMWLQALGILLALFFQSIAGFASASLLLGLGTAMVYPTLLAAIGDTAHPSWRASSIGVYRLWRDSGYAFGALFSGIVADIWGINYAIGSIALLTFFSGSVVFFRMNKI